VNYYAFTLYFANLIHTEPALSLQGLNKAVIRVGEDRSMWTRVSLNFHRSCSFKLVESVDCHNISHARHYINVVSYSKIKLFRRQTEVLLATEKSTWAAPVWQREPWNYFAASCPNCLCPGYGLIYYNWESENSKKIVRVKKNTLHFLSRPFGFDQKYNPSYLPQLDNLSYASRWSREIEHKDFQKRAVLCILKTKRTCTSCRLHFHRRHFITLVTETQDHKYASICTIK
jgi:hypothetical protein